MKRLNRILEEFLLDGQDRPLNPSDKPYGIIVMVAMLILILMATLGI